MNVQAPVQGNATTQQVQNMTCPNCKAKTYEHIACSATFEWTFSATATTFQVLGAHSEHKQPPPREDPPSVAAAFVFNRMKDRQTAKGARVRGLVPVDAHNLQDPTGIKTQRAIHAAYKKRYPSGLGFDGVSHWQENSAKERFVLPESNTFAVHAQTKWQQNLVKEMTEECIKEEKTLHTTEGTHWSRVMFCDLTYSVCSDGWYKMTSSVYSYKLGRTIPIFTSFQRRLNTEAYCSHFYHLFKHNPTLLKNKDQGWILTIKGVMLDFADSQRKGFLRAIGQYLLNKEGKLDTEDDFVEQADARGQTFSKYVHGCYFHFKQSVQKLQSTKAIVPDEKSKKWNKCIKLLMSEDEKDFQQAVDDIPDEFPAAENWLRWWLMPVHAEMIFPSQKKMSQVHARTGRTYTFTTQPKNTTHKPDA
jgi:hypothetical protein